MSTYKIPFDTSSGDQLDYPSYRNCEFRDNFEFQDTLTFEGDYFKGRSSVTFFLTRKSTGTKVTMFLSDFAALAPKLSNGEVSGTYTFHKRGQNYGCKLK